jgi:hypothetical protein
VWAYTPATFSALLGEPDPNYLKLMLKRLAVRGVLVRAARGSFKTLWRPRRKRCIATSTSIRARLR